MIGLSTLYSILAVVMQGQQRKVPKYRGIVLLIKHIAFVDVLVTMAVAIA